MGDAGQVNQDGHSSVQSKSRPSASQPWSQVYTQSLQAAPHNGDATLR